MKIIKTEINQKKNQKIQKIKFLNDNNYSLEFFNFGGYFHSINVPYKYNTKKTEDVILGYQDFDEYLTDQISLNALVGRVCGRIRNAKFVLNNKTYSLSKNDKSNHIHGGNVGFNKKFWQIESLEENQDILRCKLRYISKHLEEGYPGNLDCKAVYSFNNCNELKIEYFAECDQDTIVNLTNHNYWNFHGHNSHYKNILNHVLQIDAENVCELNSEYIPSGNLKKVEKSKFDFRTIKNIDENILSNDGIDICYEINKEKKLKAVAKIYSNITKMGMILYTDQPGLQFYTGNMMQNFYRGKYNKQYGYQFGLCMEAQLFPDAINHSNFISPVLKAGNTYSSIIIIKLKNDF